MARQINRLSATKVRTLNAPGRYADGAGLYLEIGKTGAKTWCYLYQWAGKTRQKGLGPVRLTGLAEAREKARYLAKLVAEGIDPVSPRAAAKASGKPTFGTVATQLINDRESGWKNLKHRQQWRNTLETYASSIWATPVDAVEVEDIVQVLRPIWHAKAETAKRVRGRMFTVLNAAKVLGHRSGENPADIANIEPILGRRRKGVKRHHPAMPFVDVPCFLKDISTQSSMGARALELLIHTATRTNEVLGARWKEFDLENALWVIPGSRMKKGIEHRVPLSTQVVTFLKTLPRGSEFVFPGQKERMPCSNMIMSMVMRRKGLSHYTVHGFRSSFRDWCGEVADVPREIAEQALAHQVGNEVELAYRRGDSLARRQILMQDWSNYLTGEV
ncbi:tyrosine-type recombinase/integrase [Novosphingobium percolationis]|uniref:tyrosine-type recombinase/integrase n=1 Tax=Novosphingobium percolationis TaxID=2871811 RepID=UPI001CD1C699|nr:site-specific integrase [Novosphingobium percolationis]